FSPFRVRSTKSGAKCPRHPHHRYDSFKFTPPESDTDRMDLTSYGIGLLSQTLDAAALRHRVIAQNVANVNTPGYRRLEVSFEADLARALANPGPGAAVRPRVVVADGP